MSKRINYNAITDNLVSILNTANSSGASYDLSLGLGKRISQISRDDLFITPKFKPLYPLISVRLVDKREEFVDYNGETRSRDISLQYQLFCVYDAFLDSEKSLWGMLKNIDVILRENLAFSSYNADLEVLYMRPYYTDFSAEFMGANIGNFLFKELSKNESAFNKAGIINVQVRGILNDR
jgi:hypothetical protein